MHCWNCSRRLAVRSNVASRSAYEALGRHDSNGWTAPHEEDVETMPSAHDLCLPDVESLSKDVREYYEYYAPYLRVLSMFFCTRCSHHCNPWEGLDWMHGDCTMAKLAQNLFDTARESETEAK